MSSRIDVPSQLQESKIAAGKQLRNAGIGGAAVLVGVAMYQVALAAGLPWGEAAYGGRAELTDGVLSTGYRVMSASAAVILLFAAWVIAARARLVGRRILGERFVGVGTWLITAYLIVNTVMNLASSNPVERWVIGPATAIAALFCLTVGRAANGDHEGSISHDTQYGSARE